jgi:tRNA(Ile2)-agmatinylcytidine synthase
MDDIDSPRGGCTTHFASILVERLERWHVEWFDYPNLVRLDPNIPYRTRGNGAVALRFGIEQKRIPELLSEAKRMIEGYAERGYPNTNPGFVMVTDDVPEQVTQLAKLALWRALPVAVAQRIVDSLSLKHFTMGNGRGLIGALSAIGNRLANDHTYEYLAYRPITTRSRTRRVDSESVIEMDRVMGDRVFSNVDPSSGEILIGPHGPDPVIFGIRGEKPEYVIEAATRIRTTEDMERWTVFRTNQGTGEHLTHRVRVCDLRPYMAALVQGKIASAPAMIEGGHVVFSVSDDFGTIDCAVYEPTRDLRETALRLAVGDEVCLHSGVRPASSSHGLTLNIEGIEVIRLSEQTTVTNPLCPRCGKRMKSAGSRKGFKCDACGLKVRDAEKNEIPVSRIIDRGLHLPPLGAQRHLTRPVARTNKVNSGVPTSLVERWHFP